MNNIADFLVRGLGIPRLEISAQQIDGGGVCALTGERIEKGYPVYDIIPKSTGEFLDLLGGCSSDWVSESVARVYKHDWNMGARLIFDDGTMYHPLVSRDSAMKKGRPCWSDLMRIIWPARRDQRIVAIITSDTKKRVWPMGRIGILGSSTDVLVYDGNLGVHGILSLDWPRLLDALDIFEEVYTRGFFKPTIANCLYDDGKMMEKVGIRETIEYENRLTRFRGTSEFTVATIIAQKKKKEI